MRAGEIQSIAGIRAVDSKSLVTLVSSVPSAHSKPCIPIVLPLWRQIAVDERLVARLLAFGGSGGSPERFLGAPWGSLGGPWGSLGSRWGGLGGPKGVLGDPGRVLGGSREVPGGPWGEPGGAWAPLRCSQGSGDPPTTSPGTPLEASMGAMGASQNTMKMEEKRWFLLYFQLRGRLER